MKRAKHSLSHYKLATFDMGNLVPVGLYEVLPGDTIQQATSALIRVSPLLAPVMHPVQVRIHHWFVPYRLLWNGWEDFITGGPDGTSTPTFPVTTITPELWDAGKLPDYFGIPRPDPGNALQVSLLPFRAYNMIYNEFYRDQDLQSEAAINSRDVLKVSWEKDYFTSARPWPQKGPEVTVPIAGGQAPVLGIGLRSPTGSFVSGPREIRSQSDGSVQSYPRYTSGSQINDQELFVGADADGNAAVYADLTQASISPSINDFRKAFAIQRYQEARARYGSRYTEYLRYLGVRSSDARLQRPEYLGGGKQTISFTEVLQTGPDAQDEGVASLKGHGIAAMRSRRFRRFFEEHGVVLSLASVRPRTMYESGLHRMWLRRAKEDFWQKELEHIGMQEIFKSEVYGKVTNDYDAFGYQDRYAEYRHMFSTVAGDFRNTLNHWHLARMFGGQPVLNSSFVEADPAKRIYAEQTEDGLWSMFSHSIQARRMVSRSAAGRIY